MNKFYRNLSRTRKTMFLNVSAPIVALLGAIIGGGLGIYAINLFPDKCTTQGLTTTCKSTFTFLGFNGWEATAILGMHVGIVLALAVYLFIIFGPEKTNKTQLR